MSRKRLKNDDASDIDGFSGPWAKYEDEIHISRPTDDQIALLTKSRRRNVLQDDVASTSREEKVQFHSDKLCDYRGRSFLEAPRIPNEASHGCSIPKTLTHTFTGHTKAITATKYFPKTAHLILSSSLDGKVKLWEMYNDRRCLVTYSGHEKGVKAICFDREGTHFLSASYDKYIKLWDTETGKCMQRFTTNKMPMCLSFHPEEDKSHLFLAGMSNNKIICWDCRSGESVLEYDRHLGAVNSLTFVDENRKFVSTSDDKSIRVWEWDIPVDIKYIADPTLHSMPAVSPAPNKKRLLCQSMENKLQAFSCHNNKFKLDNKKVFKGHMVAGYACVPDFSCDMSLVVSGDADGKIFFWSWSSTRILTTIQAHSSACISVMWHPNERHKLVSAGWDNLIKIWE